MVFPATFIRFISGKLFPGKEDSIKHLSSSSSDKESLSDPELAAEDFLIFKRAMDSLAEGVIITKADQDNPIIYVNQQFLKETGYTKEEMLGRNPRFLQGPESNPSVIKKVREAINNQTFFRGEIVNYRKDRSCFNNLMTINPIYNEKNELTYFAGLQSNIDYRIKIEKNLQLSNQRFNLAVKASRDVIWDLNFAENSIKWDTSQNETFEYTLNNMQTDLEWYFSHIHPEDREKVRSNFYDCLNLYQHYWEAEYRYQSSRGIYKYIVNRSYFVYNEKKQPVRMVGVMQDVTTYKELLNEQIELSRELSLSNKDLQQFGYIVSHNLRGYIARIKGLVNVLDIENFHFPEDIKILMNHLYRTAERLDETIVDLVEILHIRSNFNSHKETVSFSEVIDEVKESLQEQINSSDTEIIYRFSQVPQIATVKSYLVSIIFNLISNSIKYRSSKRPLKITLSTKRKSSDIVLEIRDNGTGIDLETHRDKVFGLYKRFHPYIEGKGLGLFLVKNQVESLGGKIEIESKVDVGTAFYVYLKDSKM